MQLLAFVEMSCLTYGRPVDYRLIEIPDAYFVQLYGQEHVVRAMFFARGWKILSLHWTTHSATITVMSTAK
jgi:hypothetical protein